MFCVSRVAALSLTRVSNSGFVSFSRLRACRASSGLPRACWATWVSSCAISPLPLATPGANFPSAKTMSEPTVKASASTESAAASGLPARCEPGLRRSRRRSGAPAGSAPPDRGAAPASRARGRPPASGRPSLRREPRAMPAAGAGRPGSGHTRRRRGRGRRRRSVGGPARLRGRRPRSALPRPPPGRAARRAVPAAGARADRRLPAALWIWWTACRGGGRCGGPALRAGSSRIRSATVSTRSICRLDQLTASARGPCARRFPRPRARRARRRSGSPRW